MEDVEEFMGDKSTVHGCRKQTGVCYEAGLTCVQPAEMDRPGIRSVAWE